MTLENVQFSNWNNNSSKSPNQQNDPDFITLQNCAKMSAWENRTRVLCETNRFSKPPARFCEAGFYSITLDGYMQKTHSNMNDLLVYIIWIPVFCAFMFSFEYLQRVSEFECIESYLICKEHVSHWFNIIICFLKILSFSLTKSKTS